MKKLFTERSGVRKTPVLETLNATARSGLLNLVSSRIDEEWFGLTFPSKCGDGYAYAGTDIMKLKAAMRGYDLLWPRDVEQDMPPSDGQVFDLVEFAYEYVAEAQNPVFHKYMSHSHYTYDVEAGRGKFAHDANRIFERNGLAFKLEQGEVIRVAPAILRQSLEETIFKTGDAVLDELLEVSRQKFVHRLLHVRRESLEKLWDAWERLKTIGGKKDKKTSTKVLLDKAATEPSFREMLEQEAKNLTAIGNKFMIRHTEIDKVEIVDSEQVDYLFHRMFSLILLLLKSSGWSR
jgi:hypothetical protein